MCDCVKIINPKKGSDLELLPCPFCGSKEIIYEQYQHAAGLRWRVFCCGCAAGVDPGYAQQPHQVMEKWNKRTLADWNE